MSASVWNPNNSLFSAPHLLRVAVTESVSEIPDVDTRKGQLLGFDPVTGDTRLYPPPTSTDADIIFVNTVEDLRANTSVTSMAITYGYWIQDDGGRATYDLQPSSDPSPGDNGGTVIERSDGRWYKLVTEGDHIDARQLGVYIPRVRLETPSGVPGYFNRWTGAKPSPFLAPAFLPNGYSTTDRLHMAISMASAKGKALLIDGVAHCDKQVLIAAPAKIIFAGRTGVAVGNTDLNMPQSYFFQSNTAMVGSVLVRVEHPGVSFHGGGILGPYYEDAAANFLFPEGLARDGIFIGANSFRWDNGVIARMGRDGFRAGDYAGGAGTNANGFSLTNCVAAYNGNCGITINDAAGILDVNAFQIDGLFAHHNQNAGITLANTYLGGVFTATIVENNGVGWFFDTSTADIVIVGGDTEANTGWRGDLLPPYQVATPLKNIVEGPETVGKNYFVNHIIQGVPRHNLPAGTLMKKDYEGRTGLFLENLGTTTDADAVFGLETTAGEAGVRKLSDALGGALMIGNLSGYPIAFVTNNIIQMGVTPNGALAVGGLSAVGTPGQVLTSQGAGSPPIWTSGGGGGGGGSPLTTKGDIYTYSTAVARLPVGTDGQVLIADSTQATGLKWSTVTGAGTVTSVGMTVPLGFSVTGSPITGAGTFGMSYAAGYQGFLTVDKAKLDSITVANLALRTVSNTFADDQFVTRNHNNPTGITVQNTDSGSIANAQVLLTANGGTGGIRLLSTAAGGQLIFGNYHTGEVAIMQNGIFRIIIDASGNIKLPGLPGGSGGDPERLWRDGSGHVRIG